MKKLMIMINRNLAIRYCLVLLLGGACLMAALSVPTVLAEPAKAEAKSETKDEAKAAGVISLTGTCTFGGKTTDWSAELTAKGDGKYDAKYVSSWGGKPGSYVGTITSDWKTEVRGEGKANGGRANGNFEFSGKYGADGIAKCTYKEIGGKRSGTMTIEVPK